MTEILRRDTAVTCEWVPAQFDPPEPCEGLSWFAVERSDGASPVAALPDTDHTRGEACEYHLAEIIDWMLGGDEKLHAIVTPRWWNDGSAGPCPACGSEVRSGRAYVPGRTGMPVTCPDEWHDEEA